MLLLALAPLGARAQAWVPPGNASLREALRLLVDENVVSVPLSAWPVSRTALREAVELARSRSSLTDAQHHAVETLERVLDGPRRQWSVAAGDPTQLRAFAETPREQAEVGLAYEFDDARRWAAELRVRAVVDAADGQSIRADGSYVAARAGNWLLSGGFIERWWGGGEAGALQLSTNARPIFSVSLDRERAQAFESRWLRWIGPWSAGTFLGALESQRADSNHALLWGARVSSRPVRGLEIALTRTAQFCGDKPPCSPGAFWDVLVGNDNVGESVSAADEPGNQLASYEVRWGGRVGRFPLSVNWQRTGETIDNRIPRPLRSLDLINLSTWGSTPGGGRWRAYVEGSTTTCADYDDAQAPDCAYENGLFTAGYRYRERALGHSTDSDSRQVVVGILLDTANAWTWSASVRRAEINRIGRVPQPNHLLAPAGPQLWWLADARLQRPALQGQLEVELGLEQRRERVRDGRDIEPRGFVRWTQRF